MLGSAAASSNSRRSADTASAGLEKASMTASPIVFTKTSVGPSASLGDLSESCQRRDCFLVAVGLGQCSESGEIDERKGAFDALRRHRQRLSWARLRS